jgi:predicted DNA-binding antitoxin AbrB/MazE fold protein
MTITVQATYENGVLKPAQPLPFDEHAQVRVTVEPQTGQPQPEPVSPTPAREPIWERLAKLAADVPPEELAKLPTDGASQHDHYLYGSPKRSDVTE